MRIFVFVVCFTCGLWSMTEQILFLPYEQKKALDALKKELSSATKDIKVSIYSFTHREIANVLRDRARSGVRVSIIYDYESNQDNTHSTIGYLSSLKNIHTCLLRGRKSKRQYYGVMHQKMAIIDDRTLILGSANWSKNAFENNYEVLMITRSVSMVRAAIHAYDKMYQTCEAY